jgi:paraquat-inducible protein A
MPTSKKALLQLHPWYLNALIIGLVAVSAVLLWMGLEFPVLTIRQMWTKNTFSVLSGIQALQDEGHRGLAALLFFFSIVFPVAKIVALAVIWCVRMTDAARRTVLHWLMVLGKWSMLDVFVVAVIVVAVKMGLFADAFPQKGIYYFGFSVLLSMAATSLIHFLATKRKPA